MTTPARSKTGLRRPLAIASVIALVSGLFLSFASPASAAVAPGKPTNVAVTIARNTASVTFTAPANTAPFFFRAACGTKVAATGLQAYQADKLTFRVLGTQAGQVRDGEVLLPLNLPAGTSTLTLEYQW